MKYVKNISVLLILFILFSCQNTNEFESELNDLNSLEELNDSHATRVTEDELETQMHWVSFLIAKAIYDDADARQFFMNSFNSIGTTSTNVVSLEKLLNSSTYDNRFEQAFEAAFYYYFYPNSDCPDDGRNPRGGPKPPGSIGGCPGPNSRCLDVYYVQYLEYLTKENCLEIFLPNGYDASEAQIYTTAHPLTNFGANEGYVMPEDCDNDLTISPFNLHMLTNVIVTRPYREGNGVCAYSDYSDVEDFTVFLNF
jgi:hypothetical protein